MGGLRKQNGEGSVRRLENGRFECVIQSQYINPETGKYKRFKCTGKTEKEARNLTKRKQLAWEREFEFGRDLKVDKTKTFGEYMRDFIDNEVAETLTDSGYHSYCRSLNANFYKYPIANYQLHMLKTKDFQVYYDSLLNGKARKTCSVPIQLCKRCCKWLVDKHFLFENYAEQAKVKREIADEYDRKKALALKNKKEVFTHEDIRKFYQAYKDNMGEYPVVALFLLETGMRSSEFAALRNSSIDLERRRIDIVEARSLRFKDKENHTGVEEYVKVPKNSKPRFIMMSDLCIECVKYMQRQTELKCKDNPEDLLYPTFRTGTRRSNTSMENSFKSLCDKLEIDRDVHVTKKGVKKGLCLHSLRHTADTIANSAKGANVVNTALMMGHTAIRTENTYTHRRV